MFECVDSCGKMSDFSKLTTRSGLTDQIFYCAETGNNQVQILCYWVKVHFQFLTEVFFLTTIYIDFCRSTVALGPLSNIALKCNEKSSSIVIKSVNSI